MKRFFICFLAFALVGGAFYACNKDAVEIVSEDPMEGVEEGGDDPVPTGPAKVSVSMATFDVPSVAGKTTNIILTSNQSEFSILPDDPAWYKTQIIGKQLVVTTMLSNTDAVRREQLVTITAGKGDNTATTTFTISQRTGDEDVAEVSVALSTYLIPGRSGKSTTIAIITNKTQLSVDPATGPWFTAAISGATLTVTTTSANETGFPRNAQLTITAGSGDNVATTTFTISQELKPEPDPLWGTIHEGGIIFWVSDDRSTCKILSLTDGNPNAGVGGTTYGWSSEAANTQLSAGAFDQEDGRLNVAKHKLMANYDKYYAVKFCDAMAPATAWYLPAVNELVTLYNNYIEYGAADFNLVITGNGGLALDTPAGRSYWSSTERDGTPRNAYGVRFSTYLKDAWAKDGTARNMRCVREVPIPVAP